MTSGDDPRDDSSPFLFGAAEREESERELEQDPPLCSNCNGSGEGYADGSKCWICRGQGVVIRRREREEE